MLLKNRKEKIMPRSLSPLRYPGGKTKLISRLSPYLQNHKSMMEPFAGGAGVSLNFLLSDTANKIYLNDYDTGIYSFWNAILTDTDKFIDRMNSTKTTYDEWQKQRHIYLSSNKYSLDLGFAAFYLNRVCRSGILTAGIIGGNDQSGKYKMDCRFNKTQLEKQIRTIAARASDINVYNEDINDFLKKNINPDAFIYLDPPYYLKGKELYHKYFEPEDHAKLKTTLKLHVTNPWIMTYDNANEIKTLYKKYRIEEFELGYSVSSKRKETELMIFSPKLPIYNTY